jgi:hypothetical protein
VKLQGYRLALLVFEASNIAHSFLSSIIIVRHKSVAAVSEDNSTFGEDADDLA